MTISIKIIKYIMFYSICKSEVYDNNSNRNERKNLGIHPYNISRNTLLEGSLRFILKRVIKYF